VDVSFQGSDLKLNIVVLDPPRTGGGVKTMQRIAQLGPQRIVYVSCNPSTFAREAEILSRHNYELRSLTLLDQFPNTYHIETIGLFEVR